MFCSDQMGYELKMLEAINERISECKIIHNFIYILVEPIDWTFTILQTDKNQVLLGLIIKPEKTIEFYDPFQQNQKKNTLKFESIPESNNSNNQSVYEKITNIKSPVIYRRGESKYYFFGCDSLVFFYDEEVSPKGFKNLTEKINFKNLTSFRVIDSEFVYILDSCKNP